MFAMSRSVFRSFLGLFLGFALGQASLHAQLDPRLQNSKTDFLDLFQQSNNLNKMKPELVTMLDFTGSMSAVMFHRLYPNTDVGDSAGNDKGMKFVLISKGNDSRGVPRYDCKASLPLTGINLTNGVLVRPDGTTLAFTNLTDFTTASGDIAIKNNYQAVNPFDTALPTLAGEVTGVPYPNTTTNPQKDVRNWVRSASHVRFTFSGKTFDIPICWTVLDSNTVQLDTANGQFRNQYMTYPLRLTMKDPATSTEIEVDRSYRVLAGTVFSLSTTTIANDTCTLPASFAGHRPAHVSWIWNTSTTIPQVNTGSLATTAAFANGIPSRSRAQGIKDAFMRTWGKYWDKVFWAYRFINNTSGSSTKNETNARGGTYAVSNDSRRDMSASNVGTTAITGGTQRAMVVVNKDPVSALFRLSSYVPGGTTHLNYAMANTLAQVNDPNSSFNEVETGTDAPVECRKTFVMIFTDGQPNSEVGTPTSNVSPYYVPATLLGDAVAGNTAVAAKLSSNCLEPGVNSANPAGQWFNIITLAGVAAHGADPGLAVQIPFPDGGYPATTTGGYPAATVWPAGTTTVGKFAPFAILQRGNPAVFFKRPHLITTMTVGLSLAQANWVGSTPGNIVATDPKFRLLAAAAVGDPDTPTWNLKTIQPFALAVPGDPTKGKAAGTCYYFDATDPDSLTSSLDSAFLLATLSSNVNSTTNPNIPFVGASFGKQVYLGKFKPPATGGVIWPGDVLMFPTNTIGAQTMLLDKNGDVAATLDETTAQWSAKTALTDNRLWSARNLWTRIPGKVSNPEPGLVKFSDAGNASTDPFKTLKPYVATSLPTDTARQTVIQFAAGGDINGAMDTSTPPRPTTNRTSIMGDVIDSSPVAIEYNFADVSGSLTPKLAAVGGNRFRLILVGSNQGWLHAFGEVTKVATVINGSGNSVEIVSGAADELWSFMPTDFLANLNHLTSPTNPHRFMVDGTPTIYHLDLPPTTGGSGNGVVDSTERAVAVFGLRKGGRSYYALDIHNPFTPTMKWSLVPDEAELFPFPASRLTVASLNQATVTNIVKTMGYSTSTPALGRISFDGKLKDAVFLGGGFSVPEVEANFTGAPKLGRSVLALDVWTGDVLAAVDLNSVAGGPIAAGLVPFEFVVNSGMAQRAYFLDTKGGLFAWGSMLTSNSGANDAFLDYRIDTSDLARWTSTGSVGGSPGIRKVAQDSSGKNALYSTLPAPFRVGFFPGAGKNSAPSTTSTASPAAVGVAMVSGDRNNPLDYLYSAATKPSNHRLTVVFDRQDSKVWNLDLTGITDTKLVDFTNQTSPTAPTITPGNTNYYLAPSSGNPYFGYYVNLLTTGAGGFIAKGISEPMVVAGSLFYSYFDPNSADVCAGGTGTTPSNLICSVINPIVKDSRANISCISGTQFTWTGVASGYVAMGTRGVLQGGVVATGSGSTPPGASATALQLQSMMGLQQERFPKARVWRTVR